MSENEKEEISFSKFFESIPPNKNVQISVGFLWKGNNSPYIEVPEIFLHCENESCRGNRFFKPNTKDIEIESYVSYEFIEFNCKNCQKSSKTYAIATQFQGKQQKVLGFKLGEWPAFGPHTPGKLIELIGPDRELFLAGRRCENQGLGIGAFVYYRRVVESQRNRIFERIIEVTEKIDPKNQIILELREAIKKPSFKESIEAIKNAIPDSLKINGHNPLTLLYKPLSEGVHDRSDNECLELAQSVRVVLVEFANNLSQALKDEAEIKDAISKLLK